MNTQSRDAHANAWLVNVIEAIYTSKKSIIPMWLCSIIKSVYCWHECEEREVLLTGIPWDTKVMIN